jgi:hypothetical protein
VAGERKRTPLNFKTMAASDVPRGRNGKHKLIVTKILDDLAQLPSGSAIQVPLAELKETKAQVRSALNRATRQLGQTVVTASDDTYLYVWREEEQN